MKSSLLYFAKIASGLLAFSLLASAANAQTAQIAPRITQAIDEGKLVTLRGNTPPAATPANDRGALPSEFRLEHMMLQLQRSPEQERALEQYTDGLTKPGSSNFHKWLTAQDFGARYGLAQSDIDTITEWLGSHGFTVNDVYPSRVLIDFSGTAGQVRSAFHTEIHALQVNGVKHIANMSDPRIPAALVPAVLGVVSLHDFWPRTYHKVNLDYTFVSSDVDEYAVVPGDLATIYNLNPLFDAGTSGQGQTVVVIETSDLYTTNDFTTFRSTFGLSSSFPSGSLTTVHPTASGNSCTDPGPSGNDGEFEATLDAEYASAAAPSATIELASCANTETTFGGFIAFENLVNSSSPPAIFSLSAGVCEAGNGATLNSGIYDLYQQAASEGSSVFISAGDVGAANCDAHDATSATHGIGVSGWASTPYNVAVGGTDFGDTYAGTNSEYWNSENTSTYESAKSYVPEIPWNDSCASVLISTYLTDSPTTYGSTGFCNNPTASSYGLLNIGAGSGGPSSCATGTPSTSGVVSGTCQGYSKPSWQSIVGNPSDGVRDLPDVSLFSALGVWSHYYILCYSDTAVSGGAPCTGAPSGWSGGGGTSFASPIWAGFQALVNQSAGGAQGLPNPAYYSLASSEYGESGSSTCNSSNGNAVGGSCIFYDVTLGDMDVDCTGTNNCYLPSGTYGVISTSDSAYDPAFGATTGWDFATGIGTVNVANLVANWPGTSSPAFAVSAATAVPSSVSPGSTATSTITVSGSGGFSGSVTLSCSVTPSKSGDTDIPTCAVTGANPVSLSSSTTNATSTVTVSTTAASAAPPAAIRTRPMDGGWLALAATITLAWLTFFGAPKGRRWLTIAAGVVFVGLIGLAACGGSGSGGGGGGGGGTGGTSADTYTVTVSAVSGSTTKTSSFTVVVN